MPPVDSTMPSDIVNAYLWADQLLRTTGMGAIDKYIKNIGYDDTLQYLAKTLYEVDDYNSITLLQWGLSAWPMPGHPDYPWHYKADPDHERVELQNHIGGTFPDTGRTGFLLACDLISDVTVQDTMVVQNPSDRIVPHMVLAHSIIKDEIKGKFIPSCVDLMKAKKNNVHPLSLAITPAIPDTAVSGTCLNFEYSPEWQKGLFDDQVPSGGYLQDSSGWWIKPGGEYIVFLYLNGVNADSNTGYFTINPFWGVFGTQGAMYRVVNGHVVDPNDDFGLGGTNLTVADWKARLRQRIYNILNP